MRKLIATTLIVLSTSAGLTAVARADYFGNDKATQQGQNLPAPFDKVEKNGI